MIASLLLVVAAAVSLAGDEPHDPSPLTKHGWEAVDHVDCPNLEPGAYYEWAGENGSGEFLALPAGGYLVAPYPHPEPPYDCRQIPAPHFIEEIQ